MPTHDTNNAYENPNQNPDNFRRWELKNIQEYKEKVYDRISVLLIEKLSQIDNGGGIQSLQKTYKDGSLVTGKSSSDVMVVYESDIEANADDAGMEDTILKWLNFADLNQLTLTIEPILSIGDGGEDQIGPLPSPDFILHLPDKSLNINQMLGTLDIADVNLKDNVSQFMGFSKSAPNINRTKFSEYIDTEISELTPITFTQFLEEYNKAKKRIPFFRYRTDDFFDEYDNSTIPIEYRIEKFFEEFSRIKDQIPAGSLANISSVDAITERGLFEYRTMTYLLKEARVAMDDGDIPEWSVNQVMSFLDRIDDLNIDIGSLTVDRDYWRDLYNGLDVDVPDISDDVYGCLDPTALNYDSVLNPQYDYCKSLDGFVSQTQCTTDTECVLSYSVEVIDGETGVATYEGGEGWTCNGNCTYPGDIIGCTDSTADNYNLDAVEDDGSCVYTTIEPPKFIFEETFDGPWQYPDMINNRWYQSSISSAVSVEGRTGINDGAIRIYRSEPVNAWPGAIHIVTTKKEYSNAEYFVGNDHKRYMEGPLQLKDGMKYRISAWGKCDTNNDKAYMFFGDTRCPGYTTGCYSWRISQTWKTNKEWTYKEFDIVAVKNKHYNDDASAIFQGVQGQIYLYAGTNSTSPGQYCDYDDVKVVEIGSVVIDTQSNVAAASIRANAAPLIAAATTYAAETAAASVLAEEKVREDLISDYIRIELGYNTFWAPYPPDYKRDRAIEKLDAAGPDGEIWMGSFPWGSYYPLETTASIAASTTATAAALALSTLIAETEAAIDKLKTGGRTIPVPRGSGRRMQRGGNKILTPEICRSYNLSPAEYDDCINYRGHYSTPAYQRGNMVTSNGRTRPVSRKTRSTRNTYRDCRINADCSRMAPFCVNFQCVPVLGSFVGSSSDNGNGGELDACNTPGGNIGSCALCCEQHNNTDPTTCESQQTSCGCNPACEWDDGYCDYNCRRGGRIGRRR